MGVAFIGIAVGLVLGVLCTVFMPMYCKARSQQQQKAATAGMVVARYPRKNSTTEERMPVVEVSPGAPPPPPPPPAASNEWTEMTDNASGRKYYYNCKTGESSWTHPADGTTARL